MGTETATELSTLDEIAHQIGLWTRKRNTGIVQARTAGHSVRSIAKAARVSHVLVGAVLADHDKRGLAPVDPSATPKPPNARSTTRTSQKAPAAIQRPQPSQAALEAAERARADAVERRQVAPRFKASK